ncbi:MAG: hypothetical protein ACRC0V_04600 [Fusobacteriaceae bacterium]
MLPFHAGIIEKGSVSMLKSPRSTFKEEFKLQIVELHKNGKRRSNIILEYKLTVSSLNN